MINLVAGKIGQIIAQNLYQGKKKFTEGCFAVSANEKDNWFFFGLIYENYSSFGVDRVKSFRTLDNRE